VPDFREAFDHFCLHAGMALPVRLLTISASMLV